MNHNKMLPRIALGAWAWGNDGTFGSDLTERELRPIFMTAMQNGLNLWDTMPMAWARQKRCWPDF